MPLFAVTGLSGAGKSSSCIEDFIIGGGFTDFPVGLRAGQHVATDIEGMKSEARQAVLRKLVNESAGKEMPFEFDAYGSSELKREGFWPKYIGEDEDGVKQFDFEGCALKRGSMLVLDEAEIFRQDKMPKEWVERLNYHRHWGSEEFPFVIVLMYQNYKPLHEAVKSNCAYAYEYVLHPDDSKRKRFSLKNPGDIPKIPRTGKGTLDEVLPRDLRIRETYVSTSAKGTATDNMAVSPWRQLWKKHKKSLIIMLGIGIPGILWAYWHLYSTYVADPKAKAAAAQSARAGAASTTAVPRSAVSSGAPEVVGLVPSAAGRVLAIVKVGDEYRHVPATPGERIKFEGQELVWPVDY